ncbi:hypothetical protein FDUTEX481_05564 [Tolypothrix sp. PCC 7601]|nr:hypothetical protein FDUTEX481_05564 [Tolypothrix sp. PCC 7601]
MHHLLFVDCDMQIPNFSKEVGNLVFNNGLEQTNNQDNLRN